MEQNDQTITEAGGGLNLLVDSSVYHEMNKIADATGHHPLIVLEAYPKIHNFFSHAMINEYIRGHNGFNGEAKWMFEHSLQEEGAFSGKEARFLYNHIDGTTKTVTLNNISEVDYGQILLTQNHKDLVLMTQDHKMLKTAGALFLGRIMDLPNFFELMKNTENEALRQKWVTMSDWYTKHGGYVPPKTVHYIEGIIRDPHPLTGEIVEPKKEDVRMVRKKQ